MKTTLFVHSSYGGDRPSITMYWRSVSLRGQLNRFSPYSKGPSKKTSFLWSMPAITRAAASAKKRAPRLHAARVTSRVHALMHGKDYNTSQQWQFLGRKRNEHFRRKRQLPYGEERDKQRELFNYWNRKQRKSKAIGRGAAAELNGAIVDLAFLARSAPAQTNRKQARRSTRKSTSELCCKISLFIYVAVMSLQSTTRLLILELSPLVEPIQLFAHSAYNQLLRPGQASSNKK